MASRGFPHLTRLPLPASPFPLPASPFPLPASRPFVTSLVQPGCPCLTHGTDPPANQIRGDHAASPTTEISSSATLANSPPPPRSRRRAWVLRCPPYHRRRRPRMACPGVPLCGRSRTVLSLRRSGHPLRDSRRRRTARIPRRRAARRPPAVRGRVIADVAPVESRTGALDRVVSFG